ncbi:hypothetical protein CEJ63_28065, partial [Acinetobacter baumannii]
AHGGVSGDGVQALRAVWALRSNQQLGYCARQGRGEACFSKMDLGSPKQLRWAKEGSQGLLVASYLAGDGRMGAFVGGAERP